MQDKTNSQQEELDQVEENTVERFLRSSSQRKHLTNQVNTF